VCALLCEHNARPRRQAATYRTGDSPAGGRVLCHAQTRLKNRGDFL